MEKTSESEGKIGRAEGTLGQRRRHQGSKEDISGIKETSVEGGRTLVGGKRCGVEAKLGYGGDNGRVEKTWGMEGI